MEMALACVGAADVAARSASKLWELTEVWRDAPSDIHRLRDDLMHAKDFLGQVRYQIETASQSFQTKFQETESLRALFERGRDILAEVQEIVESLRKPSRTIDNLPLTDTHHPIVLTKRRRLIWMTKRNRVHRLSNLLKDVTQSICGQLMVLNV